MKNFYKQFSSAVLAGICIGIGGFMNLKFGGLVGALFFSFGLLTIVCERYNLFTGIAGVTHNMSKLSVALFGNVIGCFLMARLAALTSSSIIGSGTILLSNRLAYGPLVCFLLSVPCGFIVTTVVKQSKEKNFYFPLFLGVPIFILCGFPHCIADAFNYLVCPLSLLADKYLNILVIYTSIVLGNYLGCNLYRIVPKNNEWQWTR